MKPAIRQLVDQIVDTVWSIEAQGRHQAMLTISTPTKNINLGVWPVGEEFSGPSRDAGWDYARYDFESPEEQHARAVAELTALLAYARSFLDGSADA